MFFNVFYLLGGCTTLLITLAFAIEKSASVLHDFNALLDETSSRIALCGTSIAVFFYVSFT